MYVIVEESSAGSVIQRVTYDDREDVLDARDEEQETADQWHVPVRFVAYELVPVADDEETD